MIYLKHIIYKMIYLKKICGVQWCTEPMDELHQWAFDDMCEYYERSRNWTNWTDSEVHMQIYMDTYL